MTVKKDGKNLVITIAMNENPQPSASGKTRNVATTGGFSSTDIMVDGKPVSVSVNCTIPNR